MADLLNRGSSPNDHAHADSWYVAAGKINDKVADLDSRQSRIISAGEVRFAGGATVEARIALADAACVAELTPILFIPAFMLPYDITLCPASTGVRRIREGGDASVADVTAYGAAGNGVTDDTAPLQAAIDYALNVSHTIGNQCSVYFPGGHYKITSPLKIFRLSSGAFITYLSLSLRGEILPFSAPGTSVWIIPTFKDVPAIMAQNVRAVRLADIYILGQNDFSTSVTISNNFSYLMTNSNYVINGCRDSRYSPYAGIAIDPFGTSVPADGGYPGFSNHYVANASGASNLEFTNVSVRGFVAGIILGPNGTVAQCSEMTFRNCWIEYNKVGLAICQNQSRNIHWYGGANAWNLYCFDGNTYGAQTGYAPHIYGCDMAGKYLFNVGTAQGAVQDINGIHAEVFGSIGFLGTAASAAICPITFNGCEFSFYGFGGIYVDHHLVAFAPVNFQGCQLSHSEVSASYPLRFYHSGSRATITFRSSTIYNATGVNELFLAPTTGSGAAGDGVNGVFFDGCTFGDGSSRGHTDGSFALSHDLVGVSAVTFDRVVVPLGARIKYNSASNPGQFLLVGNAQDSIGLGGIAVTTGPNGTATFTAADATILEIGDLIYNYSATNYEKHDGTISFSHNQNCVGIVSDVTGTTVTLTGWPQSLVSATYTLRLQWWNRFHQPSVGDTHTNTTVDNVTNPTSWKIGNRIKGTGIPVGAYVANIVGSTITLSKAATATATGVRLFDADVYSFTGTAV